MFKGKTKSLDLLTKRLKDMNVDTDKFNLVSYSTTVSIVNKKEVVDEIFLKLERNDLYGEGDERTG
jgi:hypothetical protein